MGDRPPITGKRVVAAVRLRQTRVMMRITLKLCTLALAAGLAALPAAAYSPKEINALQTAQRLADHQDWEGAQAAAMAAGSVGADLIEWERLRAGAGLLGDYAPPQPRFAAIP